MLTPENIAQALSCGQPRCACGKPAGGGFKTHCPAHADETPSLSVSEKDGKLLVKCFGGCSQAAVIVSLKERGLWPTPDAKKYGGKKPPVRGGTVEPVGEKLLTAWVLTVPPKNPGVEPVEPVEPT